MAVLDEDVTWWSDGGGMHGVAQKPIRGSERVARFALNLARRAPENTVARPVEINSGPGYIVYVDGKPFNTVSFDVLEDRIVAIQAVVNPDKLRTLPTQVKYSVHEPTAIGIF